MHDAPRLIGLLIDICSGSLLEQGSCECLNEGGCKDRQSPLSHNKSKQALECEVEKAKL